MGSNTKLIRYQTDQIANCSDSEIIIYWTSFYLLVGDTDTQDTSPKSMLRGVDGHPELGEGEVTGLRAWGAGGHHELGGGG
jgi:hypothetical protein